MKLTDKRFWKYEAIICIVTTLGLFLNPSLWLYGFDEYFSSWNLPVMLVGIVAFIASCSLCFNRVQNKSYLSASLTTWIIAFTVTIISEFVFVSNYEHDGFTALAIVSSIFYQLLFSVAPLLAGIWLYKTKLS